MIIYLSMQEAGDSDIWDSDISCLDRARGCGRDRRAARVDGDCAGLFMEVFLPAHPICLSLLSGSAVLASGLDKCISGDLHIVVRLVTCSFRFQRLSWLGALLSQLYSSCQSLESSGPGSFLAGVFSCVSLSFLMGDRVVGRDGGVERTLVKVC